MFEKAVKYLEKAKGEDRDEAKLGQALCEFGRSQLKLCLGANWPEPLLRELSTPSPLSWHGFITRFEDHGKVLMGSLDTRLQRTFSIWRERYGEQSVEVAVVHHLFAWVHIGQLICQHFVNNESLESSVCKRTRKLAEERLEAALKILKSVGEVSPHHTIWRLQLAGDVLQEFFVLEVIWENYDEARDHLYSALTFLEPVASEGIGKLCKEKLVMFLKLLDAIEGKNSGMDLVDTARQGGGRDVTESRSSVG